MGSMQKISPATWRGGVQKISLKGQQLAFPQDQPYGEVDEDDDQEDACFRPMETFCIRAVRISTKAARLDRERRVLGFTQTIHNDCEHVALPQAEAMANGGVGGAAANGVRCFDGIHFLLHDG